MEVELAELEQRMQELEKRKQELENATALTLAVEFYVREVHVDLDTVGFSDCPPYCDDCAWWEYISPEAPDFPDAYKRLGCETYTVTSRRGKVYTYYTPNTDALNYIVEHAGDEIEKLRTQKLSEIDKSIEKLAHKIEETKELAAKVAEFEAEAKKHKWRDVSWHLWEYLEALGCTHKEVRDMQFVARDPRPRVDDEIYYDECTGAYVRIGTRFIDMVFHEIACDDDKFERAKKIVQQGRIKEKVKVPSAYLVIAIIQKNKDKLEGYNGSEIDRMIYDDEELSAKAVENYRKLVVEWINSGELLDSYDEEACRLLGIRRTQ